MNANTLNKRARARGFATLKLMIATTVIFLSAAMQLPSGDEKIQARVEQGLSQVARAQSALVAACRQSNRKVVSGNADAGFYFVESVYVAEIRLHADCTSGEMDIRVRTQNTGAEQDPELLLISTLSDPAAAEAQPEWRCGVQRGELTHVPDNCRTALSLG